MASTRLALVLAVAVYLPLVLAQPEETCVSTGSRKGGSLIQVKTSNASSNTPPTNLSMVSTNLSMDRNNFYISNLQGTDASRRQDILMATASDDVLQSASSVRRVKTKIWWPFDIIANALHGWFSFIFDSNFEGPTARDASRLTKVKKSQEVVDNKESDENDYNTFNGTSLAGALTYEDLPTNLRNLGEVFFGTKENVKALLNNSEIATITYSGVNVTIAYRKNDDVYTRFFAGPKGEEYGLEQILDRFNATDKLAEQQQHLSKGEMLNIVDIGGHIGVISLALYKKFPGQVRAVVVEPIRLSYFYLALNLWINGVDPIPIEDDGVRRPGITAIQKAVDMEDDVETKMCVPGLATDTMYAFALERNNALSKPCDCCEAGCPDACVGALSMTMDTVFGFFPDEDIALLKVDCEGCEQHVLTWMENPVYGQRVKKLAVEMHNQNSVVATKACSHPSHLVRGICAQHSKEYLIGKEYCEVCTKD